MKDLIVLVVVTIVAFGLVLVWWPHSPTYRYEKGNQRLEAQLYLTKTYFYGTYDSAGNYIMGYYGLTDEDINPEKVLDRIVTHYNRKLEALK